MKNISLFSIHVLLYISIVLLSSLHATAATYFVSLQGNDEGNGNSGNPWRTLQKAANTVNGGDLVLVADGEYNEIVIITRSGQGTNTQIVFQSQNIHGAKSTGFKLQGDYITIDGFTLEATAASEYGVIVNGHHHNTIKNCHVLECPKGGIHISGGSTYCNVINNKLEHNGQWGVRVDGSHVLVENNEVLTTVQHHPKIPFTGFHGEDADGFRVFGDNHIIRGNYLHDLGNVEDPGNHQATPEYPNDFPHVDCLQSWDRSAHNGSRVINHSLIENNRCSLVRASGTGVMVSAIDDGCSDLTIINNIFEYRSIGIAMNEGTFNNIFVYHNVFKARLNDPIWGTALHFVDVTNYKVLNNIMVDGHAEARKIVSGTGVLDYNLVWYSDGSTPRGTPGAQEHELWGVDPQFVLYTGNNNGDYHLIKGSPAIDQGTAISTVQADKEGHLRPLGNGFDIGAYEFSNTSQNAILLLQILTGQQPQVAFDQISEINGDDVYGMAEVISLLRNDNSSPPTLSGSGGMPSWEPVFATDTAIGTSELAHWKFGKQSATTITFDDSAIGNALHGVPQMAARGLVGTWFVNPGTSKFLKMTSVWHRAVTDFGQEIANHTMNHAGGATEVEALAAINDASNYIKEHIYNVPIETPKILAFNRAGGTNWDIPIPGDAWEQRMKDHYLIERKYSTGFYKAMPFEEMKIAIKANTFQTNLQSIHFHGICDDQNNGNPNPAYWSSYIETCTCTHLPPEDCGTEPQPNDPDYQNEYQAWASCRFRSAYNKSSAVSDCKDGGTGAVKKTELLKFFDYLIDPDELIAQKMWLAGYAEARKYEVERDNGVITVLTANESQIRIDLTIPTIAVSAPMNQVDLYDGELTVYTKVPASWTACKVTQNGQSHTYLIAHDETRFELSPNLGEAVLENDTVSHIDIPYVGYP